MAPPIMRRLGALLALVGLLVLAGPRPVPASAQDDDPTVRLTLLSQTPWNSAYDETNGRELRLRFRAENLTGEAIEDLSIGVTLYGRVISRTAFEQSLATDPTLLLEAETLAREGVLEAGAARDFDVAFALDSPGISTTQSGVYPVKVELRSGFTSVASLRTAAIFLVRPPELPLALSWTFVLDHPIVFDAAGVFRSPALAAAIAPEGAIASQLRAISGIAVDDGVGPAVDIALSPVLVTQLQRLRDGYRVAREGEVVDVPADAPPAEAAAAALAQLRGIARSRNVRVSPLPYAMAEIPALIDGGLGRDISVQLQRGADLLRETLGTAITPGVFRPPGAALDPDALRELAAIGVQTLVVGPATVPRRDEDPLGFAGPPTAALHGGALDAIVPDPAAMTLLGSELVREDPVLGAQALLAQLATIWQEQPGIERGLALVLSEDLDLPGAFYPAFARGIGSAPWLDPMHAEEFVDAFPPAEATTLTAPAPREFATGYVAQLRQARRRVETLRSMLAEPSDDADRYDTLLLLAESRQFLTDPTTGLSFISAVRDEVGAVIDGVRVKTPEVITLTSSTGSQIPVTVRNTSEQPLRVGISLESPRLRETPATELVLAPGDSELVTFSVDVRSTGRFRVELRVAAPGGRVIEETSFVVRSTVYNRIALIITVVAGVALVAMWARRLWRRRRA